MHRLSSIFLFAGALLLGASSASAATIVSHYSFDSNYNDVSGNGHDATATDSSIVTITSTPTVFGAGAANFANPGTGLGTHNYASLGASPIHFNTLTPYAVSFWARPTDNSATNNGGMIMGDPATPNSFIWVEEGAGGFRFRSTTGASANFPLTTYKDGNFHHYVMQVSALDGDGIANDVTLYYDNVAQTVVKNLADTSFDIKAIGDGYSNFNASFVGQMDETWVFSGTLTPAEVTSLYTSNTVPEPASLGLLGMGAVLLLRRKR